VLKGNRLEIITSNAFVSLNSLPTLDLSHQELREISDAGFRGLVCLEYLDLGYNDLTYIRGSWLTDLKKLVFLGLKGNRIIDIEVDLYSEVSLIVRVTSDDENLCCISRGIKQCNGKCFSLNSCDFIFRNMNISTTLSILLIISVTVNVWVSVFKARGAITFFSTNVVVMCLSNICQCFWSAVVIGADLYYGESFGIMSSLWNKTLLCKALWVASLSTSIFGRLLSLFITINRYLAIIYPLKISFIEHRIARQHPLILFGLFLVSFSILSCVAVMQMEEKYPSNICLFIHNFQRYQSKTVIILFNIIMAFYPIFCVIHTFLNIRLITGINNKEIKIILSRKRQSKTRKAQLKTGVQTIVILLMDVLFFTTVIFDVKIAVGDLTIKVMYIIVLMILPTLNTIFYA